MKNHFRVNLKFKYDKSNRLLKDSALNYSDNTYNLINFFDNDGNLLTLKRFGNNSVLLDSFKYNYISGTNKLSRVYGTSDQYSYDANGNDTTDNLNSNFAMKYDNRNLLIEFRSSRTTAQPTSQLFLTEYWYDESGNRIRKEVWHYDGSDPNPEFNEDSPGNWTLVTNEFYVRDISGKELAIYNGTSLTQWNVWAADNVGKITPQTNTFFYIKDHLGSIRAVVDQNNQITSAWDYDCWGYLMQDRQWIKDENSDNVYKFTGKERDNESNYDYFGARYYDNRIGRWGTTDPLLNKYPSITPYLYAQGNPLILCDPTGLWVADFNSTNNSITVTAEKGDNLEMLYTQMGISADDFGKTYNINNIGNYKVLEGETKFDITNFVISNSNFNAEYTGSNCHGFVSFVIDDKAETESQVQGQDILEKLGKTTQTPKTGNIAIFTNKTDWTIDEFTISKYVPEHSAIYILKNQAGEEQYLNRLNIGLPVTKKTSSQIIQYFNDITTERRKNYPDFPYMEEKPTYYEK